MAVYVDVGPQESHHPHRHDCSAPGATAEQVRCAAQQGARDIGEAQHGHAICRLSRLCTPSHPPVPYPPPTVPCLPSKQSSFVLAPSLGFEWHCIASGPTAALTIPSDSVYQPFYRLHRSATASPFPFSPGAMVAFAKLLENATSETLLEPDLAMNLSCIDVSSCLIPWWPRPSTLVASSFHFGGPCLSPYACSASSCRGAVPAAAAWPCRV